MGNTNTSIFPVNILTQNKVNKCNSYTSPLTHLYHTYTYLLNNNTFPQIHFVLLK